MHLEIIFIVVVSLVCIIGFSRSRSKKSEQSEQIKLGLTLFTHIQKIMSLSQQHRGTSNAVLQGNDNLKPRLTALQRDLDKLISEGSEFNLTEFAQWESFSEHWPRLKVRSMNCDLEPKNLMRQHNMMIDGQLSLLDDIISYYGLSLLKLDDVTHVSQLCLDLLRVVETIAQARGLGSGVCAKGECTGVDQISLNFLKSSISGAENELFNELNSIDTLELSERFSSSSKRIKLGVENLVHAISTQVLTDKTTINASDYFNLATKPIDDLLDIFDEVILYAFQKYTRRA